MTLNSLTKAQLVAHIATLEAALLERNRQLKDTNDELSYQLTKPPAVYSSVPAATHKEYYGYVSRCRAQARERGNKVVTYKTFAQWVNAVTTASPV